MYSLHFPADFLDHLIGGQMRLGELTSGIAMAAVLSGLAAVGVGAPAFFVFRQWHATTLAVRSLRLEHKRHPAHGILLLHQVCEYGRQQEPPAKLLRDLLESSCALCFVCLRSSL